MKTGLAWALAVGFALWLSGCGLSEGDARRLADERISTRLAAIPTVTPATTSVPPTPQPTATPVTFPPTSTPQPVPPHPTLLPTATPVVFPPNATPQPTPTPQPTATPQPTPTPVTFPPTPTPTPRSPSALEAISGQTSGPAVFRLPGDYSLRIDPAEPLAGRDIFFTLEDLPPWQEVTVEFVDSRGEPAQWVTEDEVLIVDATGAPVSTHRLHADGSGHADWLRAGARDREGIWAVRIAVGGETSEVSYPLSQLQLPVQDMETVGVELRRYQGSVSNTYYSALVPATLAVDLQAHLAWVVDRLQESLGVQSRQIPDVYLAGNSGLLRQIAQATGDGIGFEDGYYRSGGARPGIYLRTDFLRSGVQSILTHEFTHLFLVEIAGDRQLPAWLSEGLARYYEYEFGLLGARPDAVRVLLYREADAAAEASRSGAIPDLTALENQTDWNDQADDALIDLQYAVAYMAARFLAESHGAESAIEMVRRIGEGSSLAEAMLQSTGGQYRDFRQMFVEWLQTWEDPRRGPIRDYTGSLDGIMDSMDTISARRSADLASGAPLPLRVSAKRALAADAAALLAQLEGLSAPATLEELHQDALDYVGRVVLWLSLELEYVETLQEAKLVQANDMLPEINARESRVARELSRIQFAYNLEG